MAKILVVDDEPDLVLLVQLILQRVGHEVIGADGGQEALEKLKETRPDLILLDLMMPKLDGWQTLELIRGHEEFKDIPVAMLTAKVLTPEIIRKTEIGELVDYIQKPFTKGDLVEKVTAILEHLERIAYCKSRLAPMVGNPATLEEYEALLKGERLHRRLLDILENSHESKEGEGLEDAISTLRQGVDGFRNRIKEIENGLGKE